MMGISALLKPGEDRMWFTDIMKGKLLRMQYKEYKK